MKNFVITIARGFGSGGKQIGRMLSERLRIPCYENQIVEMASEYSGINADLFHQVDERLRGSHLLRQLKMAVDKIAITEPADKSFTSDVNLFNIQAKIINELARTESCIVIGKCANYILRDYDNVVSVYIEAPRMRCLDTVMQKMGCTEEQAAQMITRTDKYRAEYYKYYSGGGNWTNPVLYDMTLNSHRLGYAVCTKLIIEAVQHKLGQCPQTTRQ